MEIILEKKDATNANLKVQIVTEDYKPKVDSALKEYSKKAVIKGFRPGKAPASLINKMYGKSLLVEEVTKLLANSVNNYISDNKIKILGEPLPDKDLSVDWDNFTEQEFVYNIGLVEDFSIPKPANLTAYDIQVNDKVLNETLENLYNQFGKQEEVETSQIGDFITGKLSQESTGFESDTLLPTDKLVAAAQAKFTGLKVGDIVTFDLKSSFANATDIANFSGKTAEEVEAIEGEFVFTVETIRRQGKAELNQELFDKVFGAGNVNSEEEFLTKVKEVIGENYKRESRAFLAREIQQELVKNSNIELPAEFLKRWIFESNQGKISQEQIEHEFEFYSNELRWNLIQSKVLEENEIKIEYDEILQRAKVQLVSQFGGAGLTPELDQLVDGWAKEYLKQDNGKNYRQVVDQVAFDKAMNALTSTLTINEKKITADEFQALIKQDA